MKEKEQSGVLTFLVAFVLEVIAVLVLVSLAALSALGTAFLALLDALVYLHWEGPRMVVNLPSSGS